MCHQHQPYAYKQTNQTPAQMTEQDSCLGWFLEYLVVRGGNTTAARKSTQKHQRQVELLLQRLHLTGGVMRQLMAPSIPMRVVDLLQKEVMMPKTISSYSCSLKKLCRFLQFHRDVASCLRIPPTTLNTSAS
ncbi:hypothetical protein HOLleu_43883 [Holothuria leucospilota]|uniref:Uncharacterized protein n=1 Tax=Holothuria leucospilota TaxID=206669 RepID=A0A9Q0YB32_HOLLE|nr:hypothetical protein HOLleu_43883 [Holothuria leucospilota]